jgi:xanthine/CO dehydrogenase XdhC/CoxF family maturation factor
MSSRRIIDSFNTWRQADEPLVMATVYATEGSTYSKAGHRIIISTSGDYQGLVSGGCVEGDLAAHAHMVFVTGEARTITYDLREDDNAIWGMGVGCDGVIKILLQRLDAATDYEPFRTIAERQTVPHGGGTCVTVIESEDSDLPTGATWIDWGVDSLAWQMPEDRMSAIRNQSSTLGVMSKPKLLRQPSRGGAFTALHAPITPIPRLLILGAGPDAVPLVTMANEIGWFVTVVDHRQMRIDDPVFSTAEHRVCAPFKEFPSAVELDQYSATVVMSHNLEADGQYLSHLTAHAGIRYIGLLGPKARRDRLVEAHDLGDPAFTNRLHGPAGVPIGADSPETIALSILADIHQALEQAQDD